MKQQQLILMLASMHCLNVPQSALALPGKEFAAKESVSIQISSSENSPITSNQISFLGSELYLSAEHPLQNRPLQAAGWNLLPLFGFGSHQQGDMIGGTVLGVLDGISWGSFILGFTPLGANYQWGTYFMLGSLSFLAGRVVGVIAPFAYSEGKQTAYQNSDLHEHIAPGVHVFKAQWKF